MSIYKRILLAILFGLFGLLFYKGVQLIAPMFFEPITLTLPRESDIPFFPSSLMIYVLVYFLPSFLILTIKKKGHLLKIMIAFGVVSLVHYLFFIFLPVKYELRPHIQAEPNNLLPYLVALLYQFDEPLNNFPSMHVSFSFLCYYFINRYKPQYSSLFLALAIAISVSTILIKQHYILDVVSGIVLAYLVNIFFIQKKLSSPLKRPFFPPNL